MVKKKLSNLFKNFLKIILYFYRFFLVFLHKGLKKPNLFLHSKGEFISDIIRKTEFHYESLLLIYCLKKYSPTLWIEIHEDETSKKNKFPYTRKKIFNYLKRKSYIKFSSFNDTNFFFNK